MTTKPRPSARADVPLMRRLKRLGLLLALLAAWAGFLLYGKWPLPSNEPRVLYEVPEHTTAGALVADLHDKELIAFPRVMKLVLRVTGWETRIRAGYYYLPARNSVVGVARKLTFGEMATRAMTIPEGRTSWEIYGTLKRYFPLDSIRFDSLVHSPEFARSLGVEANSLEGYLYPDTYVVPWKLQEQDVLRLLVSRFQEVLGGLDLDDSPFVERHGVHGLVTLASIVEKEAAVRREQRLIAGVFHNRLRKGWSLGADPTVRYAVRKMTAPLRRTDLGSDSPYNTRRFKGLPPGPIANPGEDALRATLNPVKTRMMFFVAKDDGSREHYFSETYAEHNRFRELAAQNRARLRAEAARRADSAAKAALAVAEAEAARVAAADKTEGDPRAEGTAKPSPGNVSGKKTPGGTATPASSAPVRRETRLEEPKTREPKLVAPTDSDTNGPEKR